MFLEYSSICPENSTSEKVLKMLYSPSLGFSDTLHNMMVRGQRPKSPMASHTTLWLYFMSSRLNVDFSVA